MTIESQITLAETYGMIAHGKETIRAFAQCKDAVKMTEGRQIGKIQKGEASSIQLMDAWYKGWDEAHRIHMKKRFGF